jgi:SAM-dependent methyltransferase
MPLIDQFSGYARAYATYRPTYPDALFTAVADLASHRRIVLDVATGSGQAAVGLRERFERVVGIDGRLGQLVAATRRAKVHYAAAVAEAIPLRNACCDLVVVAQALHWFDRPAFFAEVDRVLASRGVVAVWLYKLAETAPEIDALLRRLYDDVVGPYWLGGRRLVDEGYGGVELPFPEVAMPAFATETGLTLTGYLGYVSTWSAVARFRRETGSDPLPAFLEELRRVWGPDDRVRVVRWPIHLRAAVKGERSS